ncbi:MAG: sugar phosphate isomerase/epimerase family protein, partial [Phocaeicola sp.]
MKVHNYVLITLLSMGLIACHTPRKSNQSEKKEVAIQLYSARDLITHSGGGENIAPILTALGKMGYTSIEAADYCDGKFYGLTPERFKELVQAAGMTPISSHTTKSLTPQELETGDFTESLQWWDVAIEAHKAASMKYIVTPWLDTPATLHELQQYCHYYNEIGKRCRQAGLKYGYHNHAH